MVPSISSDRLRVQLVVYVEIIWIQLMGTYKQKELDDEVLKVAHWVKPEYDCAVLNRASGMDTAGDWFTSETGRAAGLVGAQRAMAALRVELGLPEDHPVSVEDRVRAQGPVRHAVSHTTVADCRERHGRPKHSG